MKKLSNLFSHPLLAPFLIQLVFAYTWFEGGWEKLAKGTFPSDISKTLDAFASKNPNQWYVNGILAYAKQNAELFGQLVQWGEILVGVGLVASILIFLFLKGLVWKQISVIIAVLSLLGGALMSVNFYYAAGWMSASTSGLNQIMLFIELILMFSWLREGKRFVKG